MMTFSSSLRWKLKAFEKRYDPMDLSQLNPVRELARDIASSRRITLFVLRAVHVNILEMEIKLSLPKWQPPFTVSRGRDGPNAT
jgi:hypothetical protein